MIQFSLIISTEGIQLNLKECCLLLIKFLTEPFILGDCIVGSVLILDSV